MAIKLPADFENYKADKRFLDLVGLVLDSEKGYVNHPEDPGGPTNCGIAWNYNTLILRELGITDIRQVTPDIARYIYYRKYWTSVMCQTIASDRLAYMHFDTAVNCGVGAAASCMIKLTNDDKLRFMEAEGKNLDFWWKCYTEYAAARKRYYTRCKNRKPFIDGWVNRLADCDERAVKMFD